jgi:CRISPR-associated protein Cas1
MPTVTIQIPGSRASLTSERLCVESPPTSEGTSRTEIPLAEIERLIVGEDAQITSPALRELLRRGVPVCFFDNRSRLLGSFEPAGSAHAAARLRQYRAVSEHTFALGVARRLVESKVSNSRRLLQRLEASHPRLGLGNLEQLLALQNAVAPTKSLEELRGIEGAAASLFYELWARFLPADFPFERRTRRPPLNPVNACLSYLATLLYGECLSACHAAGLDPGLGCLHTTEDGRWALPLDLMEPFRPVLVESLTLRLFAWRVLQAEHFEPRAGGVYLNTPGRRALWQHYEQRLNGEFYSEHAGCRTTLRTRIAQTPLHFKTCLEQPELFSPFRLN